MWEYAEHGMTTRGLHEDLQNMGRDGWELVSHHIIEGNNTMAGTHFMVFKRKVEHLRIRNYDYPAIPLTAQESETLLNIMAEDSNRNSEIRVALEEYRRNHP